MRLPDRRLRPHKLENNRLLCEDEAVISFYAEKLSQAKLQSLLELMRIEINPKKLPQHIPPLISSQGEEYHPPERGRNRLPYSIVSP